MANLKKSTTTKKPDTNTKADEELKATKIDADETPEANGAEEPVAPADKAEDTGVTISGVDEAPHKDADEGTEPVAPIPPKSVKIKMAVSHRCSIGGVRYDLVKGKTYTVPENVKRVLSSAGLLLPL